MAATSAGPFDMVKRHKCEREVKTKDQDKPVIVSPGNNVVGLGVGLDTATQPANHESILLDS